MSSPPIQVFLTTIASQPALRQRQEYILRILQVKKIAFTSYDLASDEDAKKLWKRKAPLNNQQLPGILVGGRFPGTFTDFEEAVEYNELTTFLRLNEEYHPEVENDRPLLPSQPIGVPGAMTPMQMTNHKPSFAPNSPSPLKDKERREKEFDIGDELVGFGLQGVKVTEDDLAELVKELGLEGDDAGDLVRGLTGNTSSSPQTSAQPESSSDGKQDAMKTETKVNKNKEAPVATTT